MKRAPGGVRPSVSSATRYGSRGQGSPSRTVNSGSSRITVVTPTTIASASLLHRCARALAGSPVIQREAPWASAIFPSSVIAALSVTWGRRSRIAVKNTRFWSAASSARSPTVTSMAARRRTSNPRPATRGFGSTSGATTRATPASTIRVVQGGDALADADQLDRHLQLAHDPHDDAALGGAVELRQRDAGEADRLVEHARLGEAVLARRRVEDHERLVWTAGELPLDHALELRQLFHQVRLCVQAPGRVDDQRIRPAGGRGLHGVEHDRRRIRAGGLVDHLDADP